MNRVKLHTLFRDTYTHEIVGEGEFTPARVNAIIKAYKAAGEFVEAVTL